MNRTEKPVYIAVIGAAKGKEDKVRYAKVRDHIATNRYHSLVDSLRMHGAGKMDAYDAAKWIYRTAKPSDRREIEPGIEIVIEEVGDG